MLNVLSIVGAVGIMAVLLWGVSWPWLAILPVPAADKTLLAGVGSIIIVFVYAWGLYILNFSWIPLWLLPVAGALGLILRRRQIGQAFRDSQWRTLISMQGAVTVWCLAWNAMVSNYSGGGWAGDWYEHWERTVFYLRRGPLDTIFIASYTLTARPPLTNVLAATLLYLTKADFAHFQVVMTVLGSLAFFPAALLSYRWRPEGRTVVLCALFFMASPFFVENATFPWTKLPAALLVLASIYFALASGQTLRRELYHGAAVLAMTAGFLSHYSAGPYGVVLGALWFWKLGRAKHKKSGKPQLVAIALSGFISALWFGWAVIAYGTKSTFASNTSVRDIAENYPAQISRAVLNIRDTIVPYFARSLDQSLIAQTSSWGRVRDDWFQLYQLNLYFAFGVVGGAGLGWALVKRGRSGNRGARTRVTLAILTVIFLGIGVHGPRDTWGLAQICLQPLVLLGLAFLASEATGLSRVWRFALVAGALFDLAFGIVLQFLVQNFAVNRWFSAEVPPIIWLLSYNRSATINLHAKLQHKLAFLNDFAPDFLMGSVVALVLTGAFVIYSLAKQWRPLGLVSPGSEAAGSPGCALDRKSR